MPGLAAASRRGQASTHGESRSGNKTSVSLSVKDIVHGFGGATVLKGVSLDVRPGEFLTLLGPSGSGKTTLLRIIAGMLQPDSGRIELGGKDVTGQPLDKREVGFVFQNYALFPHLSVADNVGFPLDVRKVRGADRRKRVDEVLQLVQMESFSDRYPSQLSGGQQQRVSVARALAARPNLLLMDEPLGALDRRLREDLQIELRRLQREVGTTTVYVTHDQDEAFGLSDRIAVMNHGEVEQLDTAPEIYSNPDTAFVARFVGDINSWVGPCSEGPNGLCQVTVDGIDLLAPPLLSAVPSGSVEYVVRPESIRLNPPAARETFDQSMNVVPAVVELVTFYGNRRRIDLKLHNGRRIEAMAGVGEAWKEGDEVVVTWPVESSRVFVAEHEPVQHV